MHNLKEIRKDFSKFEKDLEKRSVKIDLNNLKKLDELNRDLIQKKENLEKEKKDISKTKDKSLFSKSKEISQSIDKINDQQSKIKSNFGIFPDFNTSTLSFSSFPLGTST